MYICSYGFARERAGGAEHACKITCMHVYVIAYVHICISINDLEMHMLFFKTHIP